MAAFTTAVVTQTGLGDDTVTITFNAAAIDCNSTQLLQLQELVNKCVARVPARPQLASAAVTYPATGGWGD